MITYNQIEVGKEFEREACVFLQAKGLRLIEQNYRCYHGEIDLIMQDRDDIVFVEVRGRSRTDYGNAFETITKHKRKKLIKAATHFLQKKNWLYKVTSRFDAIAIHPVAGEMQLEWMKNAFWIQN